MINLLAKLFFLINTIFIFNNSAIKAQSICLDDFEDLSEWNKIESDGAKVKISSAKGFIGKGIKIDFEFQGAGFCGIARRLKLDLTYNYKFYFYLSRRDGYPKANEPLNNFEFKLTDSTAENVWWKNNRNFEFPKKWEKIIIKKRHITFAWGPKKESSLEKVERIELIISASQGGKGTVYIDELNFEPLPKSETSSNEPTIIASSSLDNNSPPNFIIDNNPSTVWRSLSQPENQSLTFDLHTSREYGGLVIDWASLDFAKRFTILSSNDNENWEEVYKIREGTGKRNYIPIKEGESRFLKLQFDKSSRKKGYAIKDIEIKGTEFSETPNNFFETIAQNFPRGYYPKYFNKEQTYWTLIGAIGDTKEGLINEEGMIEVDKQSFSLEPFLFVDNRLITWNDVSISQSLEKDYLPIPAVEWNYDKLNLQIKTFGEGKAGKSSIYIRYKIKNNSKQVKKGSFYLAIRPFQVCPPWHDLNMIGGVSKINKINYYKKNIRVNDEKIIVPITRHNNFGAINFDGGELIDYLSRGLLPTSSRLIGKGEFSFASAALKYSFNLQPGESKEVFVVVPFHPDFVGKPDIQFNLSQEQASNMFNEKLEETISFWESKLNQVQFSLPPSADKIMNTLRTTLAYILINRDGLAIQPGSRTYERAWIRDGSLTSNSLLKMGFTKEVKEYLDWYEKYQFESGKIPCVVDQRGADPVPEYDSQGEFIYAVYQYFLFMKDTSFLKSKLNNIIKAVNYIDFLRQQRMTDKFKYGDDELRAFYGLVPESISHEGYSAKPMHSYWDNFFVLLGLKDATSIANVLGKTELKIKFTKMKEEFQHDLYSSINLAMKNKNINFIPGCVELGDFDVTSTAAAIAPCDELQNLPQKELMNTFEKYYEYFIKRLDTTFTWENYTPYEIRIAGTFLYLNNKERAHKVLNFFFNDQRPKNWNQWAEVVWRDIKNPKFIGDMPHTWVGSDYINSVRAMFAYEREYDNSLIIGAGIKEDWLKSLQGVSIKDLPTYFGTLNYLMLQKDNTVEVKIDSGLKIEKLIIKSPLTQKIKSVTVNGKEISSFTFDEVVIDHLPAIVVIIY